MMLKNYRSQHDLSQVELAEMLGISRQLVGLIEIGKRRITPENAAAWAPKLGVDRESLCSLFTEKRKHGASKARRAATAL